MTRESFLQDVMVFNFGEVTDTKSFIAEVAAANPNVEGKEEIRQCQVDEVMNRIKQLHTAADEYRKSYL